MGHQTIQNGNSLETIRLNHITKTLEWISSGPLLPAIIDFPSQRIKCTLCCPSCWRPNSCTPTHPAPEMDVFPGHVRCVRGPITVRLSWKCAPAPEHPCLNSEWTCVERRGKDAHSPEPAAGRTLELIIPASNFIWINFWGSLAEAFT